MPWKKHNYFINTRIEFIYIPASLLPSSPENYKLTRTTEGEQCNFGGFRDWATAFLDTIITEGVFRWTVKIEYRKNGPSHLRVGVAHTDRIRQVYSEGLGSPGATCCLGFSKNPDGSLVSTVVGVEAKVKAKEVVAVGKAVVAEVVEEDANGEVQTEFETEAEAEEADAEAEYTHSADIPEGAIEVPMTVPDYAVLAAEVDMDARTISVFVNDSKVPCVITRIPVPLFFGMSGCLGPSFTSLSLRRMPSSSSAATTTTTVTAPSPPPFAGSTRYYYECKPKYPGILE